MGRGAFLFALTNLFTIQRWNNRPALVRFTEADNAFNTFFLNAIYRLDIGSPLEPALRWRFSRELPKVVLSDISLQLKERIERFSPSVWKEVADRAINDLKSIADWEFVELFFDKDVSQEPYDRLADLYISYLEAYENGKLFDYNQPLMELREKVLNLSSDFENQYYEVARYVWIPLLNLTSMVRWNRTHRNVRTSVSGHSFVVLTIAYAIAKLTEFDRIEEVILRAMLHDFPEAFTGDVITPTKKKVPGLDKLVSEVEREMVSEWINGHPKVSVLNKYLDYCVEPFDGDAGLIVRTADYFASLLECGLELYSGNKLEVFRTSFFSFKKLIKETSPIDVSDWIDEIEALILR
ncbi:HD domain-containing protein [Fervidobacterium thailandense]|uniref:Phosphohydrolase n=1 Tax=Fervidobacterium thailandense TaxID=1008305 RepID=A0A1E3G4P2_9BACT|nr:YfbR-like 5'-deoxynucleotidase [Fervidobacterium thailandense]ODN30803.1 phosphohydrolase [Fervidobacterium thailandense]